MPKLLIRMVLSLLLVLSVSAGSASAQAVSMSSSGWLPGPDASGSTTLSGTVEEPGSASATQLTGWVVDPTAAGWSGIDDVQVWDGLMQAGGSLLAHALFQQNRPDVAATLNNPYWAASGFVATVPASASTLLVYAHTPSRGWWFERVTLNRLLAEIAAGPTIDIERPTPLGTVHNAAPFTMQGFAYDPAAGQGQGTGVDRVQVYLDGDRRSGIYIGDATLGSFDSFAGAAGGQFATAGWRLTFQPSSWMDNQTDNNLTTMTVYAHSSVTGTESQAQTMIVISVP